MVDRCFWAVVAGLVVVSVCCIVDIIRTNRRLRIILADPEEKHDAR